MSILTTIKHSLKTHKFIYLISAFILIFAALLSVELSRDPQFFAQNFKMLKNSLKEKSTAELSLNGEKLEMQFKITPSDEQKITEFSQNLGVDKTWTRGIKIAIDPETRNKLSQLLPITLNLEVNPEGLMFKSSSLPSLQSTQSKDEINFATESANMNLKYNNEEDFSLNITEPNSMLKYATQSGQINISSKIQALYPLLSKIGTINLSVNGRNINGEILLK